MKITIKQLRRLIRETIEETEERNYDRPIDELWGYSELWDEYLARGKVFPHELAQEKSLEFLDKTDDFVYELQRSWWWRGIRYW
jgi:hypothetical protein